MKNQLYNSLASNIYRNDRQSDIDDSTTITSSWLPTDSLNIHNNSIRSNNSLRRYRIESEREISEITHDNTLYEQNGRHSWDSTKDCTSPILIKEITETVEIDRKSEEHVSNMIHNKRSMDTIGNCQNTRVTIVRDVRANISESTTESVNHQLFNDNKQTPRIDLETLYIVECARPAQLNETKPVNIPVINEKDTKRDGLAGKLKMDHLLKLNSMIKDKKEQPIEYEFTHRYELHEYSNSVCLLMYVGYMDKKSKLQMANQAIETLTTYENRCKIHLDVIVDDQLGSFILPYSNQPNKNSILVSVNYVSSKNGNLLGCERRYINTLSEPIKAALSEAKTNIGDENRYLSMLLVSTQNKQNKSSHQIVEKNMKLIEELRRNILSTLSKNETQLTTTTTTKDEGIQVKPAMCDEAINSTLRGSIRRFYNTRRRDASTSPAVFNHDQSNDDEYAANIFQTNLDLTTKKIYVPGIGRTLSKTHESGKTVASQTNGMSSEDSGTIIEIDRQSKTDNYHRLGYKPFIPNTKGFTKKEPLLVKDKRTLVNKTLDDLRQSIRQHPRDSARAQMDTCRRSNSWSSKTHLKRVQTPIEERHVRAKLIPIWNSPQNREYFTRVEDYVNEKAARSIKRSYSNNYLSHAPCTRIRWVRIPGETIRIEEQRTVDIHHRSRNASHVLNAECRELPYELRYWNILHLLNKERESGKQLGRVFPYSLEEWILSNNLYNGVKQTAQEILSPQYKSKSIEDNALIWFLTYDDSAKTLSDKYTYALMNHGEPRKSEEQCYRQVERFTRFKKLPDRFVPVRHELYPNHPNIRHQYPQQHRFIRHQRPYPDNRSHTQMWNRFYIRMNKTRMN